MKYVWIVMCGCIGDSSVRCVCTTEKKAIQKIKEMNEDKYDRQTHPWYEKWEVDKDYG